MPGECDIGLIGLGVMGRNLALNIADHGYRIAVFNRTQDVTSEFISGLPSLRPAGGAGGGSGRSGGGGDIIGCETLEEFVRAVRTPRIAIVLVKAGPPIDAVCNSLINAGFEADDIVVDGGNSRWTDTIRRERAYEGQLIFFGSGISGGELGARFGPSLMPGGDPQAWERLRPIWEAIAAKVDPKTGKEVRDQRSGIRGQGSEGRGRKSEVRNQKSEVSHEGLTSDFRPLASGDTSDLRSLTSGLEPCAVYLGPNGAGHYVKMVHNGIEYADMQLIAEAYHLLRSVLGLSPAEIGGVFAEWNTGDLDSFLIEITADILKQRDPITGRPFVDVVLDAAGQKGTGRWTAEHALELGVPAMTIAEAVFARGMSAMKDDRVAAAKVLPEPRPSGSGIGSACNMEVEVRESRTPHPLPHGRGSDNADFIDAVRDALYCSKLCAYAQGFHLMAAAQDEHDWQFDFGAIAKIWRGGCIIRAVFLQKIAEAYQRDAALPNLLLDPYFAGRISELQHHWRHVVASAAHAGIPTPAFSSALAYYDSYRSESLPANLIQAQRDYFGAHTYERTDQPRGKFFHLDWPADGRPQIEA